MIAALASGGSELAVMRIVARIGSDPPQRWDRLNDRFVRIRRALLPALRANLPGVGDEELLFRARCVAGLLNWLALAPIGGELRRIPAKEIEELLTPVVAGAFRGSP
jgi:hypothetical protein